MNAIKLMMTFLAVGLLGASCTTCQAKESPTSFETDGDDWFELDDDLDMDIDFDWNIDFDWIDESDQVEVSDRHNRHHSRSQDSRDTVADVPKDQVWSQDENFYTDQPGAEGEELDWEDIGHPGIPGPNSSALWIVYPYSNSQRTTHLVMPVNRYAKELIIPGSNGDLTIYEKYPDNEIFEYHPGLYVMKDRAYKTWFFADTVGTHTVWYKVHDERHNVTTYSNQIVYNVSAGTLVVVVPDIKVYKNETAVLTARASGGCDPSLYTYKWYEGKSSAGTLIANETNSTYRIPGIQTSGNYTCKVTCPGNKEAEDWGLICVIPERTREPPENLNSKT